MLSQINVSILPLLFSFFTFPFFSPGRILDPAYYWVDARRNRDEMQLILRNIIWARLLKCPA